MLDLLVLTGSQVYYYRLQEDYTRKKLIRQMFVSVRLCHVWGRNSYTVFQGLVTTLYAISVT